MIDLRKALTDYLDLRRSLGFKLQWAEQRLSDFIDHLQDAGSAVITIPLALSWAKRPEGVKPNWWVTRLGLVGTFVHRDPCSKSIDAKFARDGRVVAVFRRTRFVGRTRAP